MKKKIKHIFMFLLVGALSAGTTQGLQISEVNTPNLYSGTMFSGVKEGYMRNNCLSPRVVELIHSGENNGKMYATFECGKLPDDGKPTFPIYESINGGRNWTLVGHVKDTQHGWGMMNCPQIYELPQALGELPAGTLICAGNSVPSDYSKTSMDFYYSTDLGRNWTFLSTIATGGRNEMGYTPVWEPFFLQNEGRLICYYSDETDPEHAQKLVHKVTENGTEWEDAVEDVAFNDSGQRPGMPIVAKMENGQFIMVYEGVGLNGLPCNYVFSDDPEKWNAAEMGTQFTNNGSPYVTVLDNGAIVANANDTTGGDVFVNSEKDGTGEWIRYKTPLPSGYNRQIMQLSTGELFIIRGSGSTISYATMDLNTSGLFHDSYVNLQNTSLNQMVGIEGNSNTENARAFSWTADGSWNQKWVIEEVLVDGATYCKLLNAYTGKVLSIRDGSTTSESDVVLKTYANTDDQLWQKLDLGNAKCVFINKKSGKALEPAASMSKLVQRDYIEGKQNQVWKLNEVSQKDRTYQITVDIYGAGTVAKNVINVPIGYTYWMEITPDKDWLVDQVFVNETAIGSNSIITITSSGEDKHVVVKLREISKDAMYLTSKVNNKVIALTGGQTSAGTKLIEWINTAGLDQQWVIEPAEKEGYVRFRNNKSNMVISTQNNNEGSILVQQPYSVNDDQQMWRLIDNGEGYYVIENSGSGCVITRGVPEINGDQFLIQKIYNQQVSDDQLWYLDYVVKPTYNVNTINSDYGQVILETNNIIKGGNVNFTVEPKEGYQLVDVLINGVSIGAVTNYTIENIQSDMVVEAVFEVIPPTIYSVNTITNEGGTIVLDTTEAIVGSNLSFTVEPVEGYRLTDVLINGVSIGAVTNYTIENIQSDMVVEAMFESTPTDIYTIRAQCQKGGTLTLEKSTVLKGDTVAFQIILEEGYEIKEVKVNGTSIGKVSDYIIQDVQEDIHIVAQIKKIK